MIAEQALPRQVVTQKRATGWKVSEQSAVGRLARFFPEASPVRIPVTVSIQGRETPEPEATVIEFGTPRDVLFACRMPLEFADKVRLQTADGSLATDAWVVAVHYHEGHAAVAARFAQEVKNWLIKS